MHTHIITNLGKFKKILRIIMTLGYTKKVTTKKMYVLHVIIMYLLMASHC